MLPAIHLLGIHITMYSLMVFLGIVAFFVTYFVLVERVEKLDRFNSNRLLLVSAIGIVVLGASAFVLNSVFHSIEKGELVIGGITWLGGVVGAFAFMIFAIHKFVPCAKGNAVYYFSLIIPGLVLGHAFGRIGCFCAGCCFGARTDGPLGVSFPAGSAAAQLWPGGPNGSSLPVYPTQLFEAAFEFVLALVLIIFYKRLKKYNVEIYLIAYGAFRFAMEFLRGDDRGATKIWFTPSQLLCVLMFIAAALLILYRCGVIFKGYHAKCEVWQSEAAKALAFPRKKDGEATKEASTLAAIKELHEMMEAGIISEQEFEAKKQDLLKRL